MLQVGTRAVTCKYGMIEPNLTMDIILYLKAYFNFKCISWIALNPNFCKFCCHTLA